MGSLIFQTTVSLFAVIKVSSGDLNYSSEPNSFSDFSDQLHTRLHDFGFGCGSDFWAVLAWNTFGDQI
jgi:hypothetical protein